MIREMLEQGRLRHARDGECLLLLLDLVRFKMVDDTLCHAVGDQLLAEVARRLEQACGEEGTVGRLGGDELAVVVGGATDTLTLITLAERIADAIDRGFHIGMSAIHIGVSIGIARAPSDGDNEDRLMRSADLALYRGAGALRLLRTVDAGKSTGRPPARKRRARGGSAGRASAGLSADPRCVVARGGRL